MRTLEQILIDANTAIQSDVSVPTGEDLSIQTNYANRAIYEAANVAQLPEFNKEYTAFLTGPTLSLPSDFREFKTMPRALNNTSWDEYEEISPEDKYNKDSDEDYCYVLGNNLDGANLIFNGLPDTGATISFIYQKYPEGFSTLTDKCELSDSTYVSRFIEARVLESRNDAKFQVIQSDADKKLANMISRGQKNPGGSINTTPKNFRNPLA